MYFYYISLIGLSLKPLTFYLDKDIDIGLVVEVELNGKKQFGCVIDKLTSKPEFECNKIVEVTQNLYSKEQLELAKFISTYYSSSLGVAISLFTPFFVSEYKKAYFEKINPIELSKNQNSAFKFAKNNKNSLLFGDTGSGKTEIYISLIYEALKDEKNIIYLLPEIGLTPQLESRLKFHFGDMVGIWHSKITKTKKIKLLNDIVAGNIRVILGARSALFLPLKDIGLIVVDEEHDDSYKSNSSPRYNARDLALYYGKKIGATVVLGSATPNVTTLYKLPHIRLKGGYFESKKEIIFEDEINEITQNVIKNIDTALKKDEQVIVFLPTRAHFKYIICMSCGANITCPFCSVSLSLHKHHNILKCHYCNFTSKIITTCPKCGSETMEATRLGTAEVVDRLREIFKDIVIEKFDKDDITTDAKLKKRLNDFKDGKIDILVGTQMLSKGHDYHKVGLCVILGIDNVLSLNDFRSREKALSLSIQLAGRSGRKDSGVVFLQTKNINFFREYIENYEQFAKDELSLRKELYPPFKKLLRVLISHKSDSKANDIMHEALKIVEKFEDVEIVGYGKADIEKIANKYRYNILLRCSSTKPLLQVSQCIKNSNIQIDIDPISFS